MKRLLALVLVVSLSSCFKESSGIETPVRASAIVGTWQIISNSYSIGGPQINEEIKDGGFYSFDLNGSFSYNDTQNPSLDYSGTFEIEEELIVLFYTKSDESFTWKWRPDFKGDILIVYQGGPTICIEGCSFTLKRKD